MYVLASYDAAGGRSETFRKLLSRYLVHELESVFAGELTEGSLTRLRKELAKALKPDDAVMILTAENKNNVRVVRLSKGDGNGAVVATPHDHHVNKSMVL